MSHSRRGRLDPRKTKRELRKREREVGVRRRIDPGYVIVAVAITAFIVAMLALFFSTYK